MRYDSGVTNKKDEIPTHCLTDVIVSSGSLSGSLGEIPNHCTCSNSNSPTAAGGMLSPTPAGGDESDDNEDVIAVGDRDSDGDDSERNKVSDIIRRLTIATQAKNSRDAGEQLAVAGRNFAQIVKSPRIRGRQAFNDLLLRMVRDRQRELQTIIERQPVSKFSHRRRIQSMLRVRFLHQKRADSRDDHRRRHQSSPAVSNLGGKFRPGNEKASSSSTASSVLHTCKQELNEEKQIPPLLESSVVQCEVEVNEEEEDDCDNDQLVRETWFSDISRPLEDWENRRQARYREMIETPETRYDVKQLLERRTVSSFLVSEQRNRMDQLMTSFVRRRQVDSREEAASREVREEENCEGEDDYNHDDRYQFRESLGRRSSHDLSEFLDQTESRSQMPLPPLKTSWHYCEIGLEKPDHRHQSHCYRDRRSCTKRMRIGKKFMCDTRSQLKQLRSEICELQKSIASCIEMKGELQRSLIREVSNAVGQLAREGSMKRGSRCCICYEAEIDSLLYRCGHMCACLKCAHHLQDSTRTCPICRAPIMDVLRAYMYNATCT